VFARLEGTIAVTLAKVEALQSKMEAIVSQEEQIAAAHDAALAYRAHVYAVVEDFGEYDHARRDSALAEYERLDALVPLHPQIAAAWDAAIALNALGPSDVTDLYTRDRAAFDKAVRLQSLVPDRVVPTPSE
jgi:hypothetical protein